MTNRSARRVGGILNKLSIVKSDYQGLEVNFTEDGWFNATKAAEKYGKRPVDWLALDTTKEYISTLHDILKCENSSHLNTPSDIFRSEKSSLLKVKRGGKGGSDSTWFHPKLTVPFARWLNIRFSIWCDLQIDGILKGNHPHFDWKRVRHEATSSYKVMNAVLQLVRQNNGKPTQFFHYANEAKLVNWAITGEFKPLDRNSLSHEELDLLAKLEECNAVLVGCGLSREDRKSALSKFVSEFKTPALIEAGVSA